MAIITGTSLQFSDGTNMGGVPFSYHRATANSIAVGTGSWTNNWDTGNFSIPSGSMFKVLIYMPTRQDGGAWGGHYFRFYWQYNDDGNWRELGHSGYGAGDHSMTYNGGGPGRISHYENEFMFDFRDQSASFNIRFLFQHLSHTTTTYVNNSGQHNYSDGNGTYTESNGYNYRQKITIWGTGNARS